jgi:hypothetical protein
MRQSLASRLASADRQLLRSERQNTHFGRDLWGTLLIFHRTRPTKSFKLPPDVLGTPRSAGSSGGEGRADPLANWELSHEQARGVHGGLMALVDFSVGLGVHAITH